jgi:hypothetical protein
MANIVLSYHHAMQLYCETYIASILKWDSDADILKNRILLLGTIDSILRTIVTEETAYEFDLVVENPNVPLDPEVIPSAGNHYIIGGDNIAFTAAKAMTQDKKLFHSAGMYFQKYSLKSLMGISENDVKLMNSSSRASCVRMLKKLFRLSNNAGEARIIYHKADTPFGDILPSRQNNLTGLYPFVQFEGDLEKLYVDLTTRKNENAAIVNTVSAPATTLTSPSLRENIAKAKKNSTKKDEPKTPTTSPRTNKKRKATSDVKPKKTAPPETEIIWVTRHESINEKVSMPFFNAEGVEQFYKGRVTKYAPPTDQDCALYHIVWEDGDQQDMDDDEFAQAKENYKVYFS